MSIRPFLLSLIFFSSTVRVVAQSELSYPKIGEPIGEYSINDVKNYNKPRLSLSDFRGKWLIVDIWTRICTGCIASFPSMQRLQDELKDSVNVVMLGQYNNSLRSMQVGKYSDEQLLKAIFQDQSRRNNLSFIAGFDSTLTERFALMSVPTIFVVNPEGIIVGKATKLTTFDMRNFMAGKRDFSYNRQYSRNEPRTSSQYNTELPLLTNGQQSNGGSDTCFISRSLITTWNPRMPLMNRKTNIPGCLEMFGRDLQEMLLYAYFGKPYGWSFNDSLYHLVNRSIIVECDRKELFGRKDEATGRNMYSYSQYNKQSINNDNLQRKILLEDIHRTFCFKTVLEERTVDAYSFIVLDSNKVYKLRSKKKKRDVFGSCERFKRSSFDFQRFS
ncbi:TlpA family protein disulfide reductase [Chitinophaga sedimenti]|uniref:TlpA family protein disulfide reductase n=1 Tax=Chitinophaga sedimenti TaxID=2033606 RepID=UPI002003703E|nr:TlpA disulfide reductase family protein [Chitinophaga sedimenti]MCK7553744.1 TlpA family protein disulfide reductase [Chitinophaga sedimenti]